MTILFRTLFLFAFALFWGGLTFYTGIVVRIMHDVLNDPMDGGFITQRVTNVLQVLGGLVAVLMVCNAWPALKICRRRGAALIVCAVVLALSLVGLYFVHAQLDAVISLEEGGVLDRDRFVIGHRRYNQLTTIEWIASLVYLPIAMSAWRTQDAVRRSETGLGQA